MRNLIKLPYLLKIIFFLLFCYTPNLFAVSITIEGNNYSDENAILSIIDKIPDTLNEETSNDILKKLNQSGLFKSVEVLIKDNGYLIKISEFPSIRNFYFKNNDRLKDEDIESVINELNIDTLADIKIDLLVNELKEIYKSYGYNNIKIITSSEILSNNTSNLFLEFYEGKITKIRNIKFFGNTSFEDDILLSRIKTKVKSLRNIFANNNFKLFQINNDMIRIKNFYKTKGFRDIKVEYNIEYFATNKVNVNFKINEGEKYIFSSIKIDNKLKNINKNTKSEINNYLLSKKNFIDSIYNNEELEIVEYEIAEILKSNGNNFFEIKILEKINGTKAEILIEILSIEPKYINQINIKGNTRTYDYVIRRELDVSEGDPINNSKIKQINKKLRNLNLFSSTSLKQITIEDQLVDLDIEVEETQTGTFNIGLSVGTLDGAKFLTGLKEKNIGGTGRSLELLINTSDNNNQFTFKTNEKFFLNNQMNLGYRTVYSENDYSKSKSYKLNMFEIGAGLSYLFSDNLNHSIDIGYEIKDYLVTNSSTVSSNIDKSSGKNVSINLNNIIQYNTLNSFIRPSKGNYFQYVNIIESPTSSSNGIIKNTIVFKKFLEKNKNIYSFQTKIGNVSSLNDNEILSDDKFSLGGRWLRGFDNYGAGPRNSRTSYIGGNNLFVSKFDFSKPISLSMDNPIYLNLFNDYGIVWSNKNTVTSSKESLRSSYGFGLKFYSPIGPIGFTWGFPLSDEEYDIKRMFLFSIGNIN